LKSRLRHYTNLKRMHSRLSAVLARHRFTRFCDILAEEELKAAIGVEHKFDSAVVGSVSATGTGGRQ